MSKRPWLDKGRSISVQPAFRKGARRRPLRLHSTLPLRLSLSKTRNVRPCRGLTELYAKRVLAEAFVDLHADGITDIAYHNGGSPLRQAI